MIIYDCYDINFIITKTGMVKFMEKIKNFYLELAKSEEFKEKLAKFRQENDDDFEKIIEKLILPQAVKMGYNFTKEDLLSYEKENESDSLSDDDLINVAGGFAIPQLAAITLGALMSLSAAGGAVNNFLGSAKANDQAISLSSPKTSYTQMLDQVKLDETQENQDEKEQENLNINNFNYNKENDEILSQSVDQNIEESNIPAAPLAPSFNFKSNEGQQTFSEELFQKLSQRKNSEEENNTVQEVKIEENKQEDDTPVPPPLPPRRGKMKIKEDVAQAEKIEETKEDFDETTPPPLPPRQSKIKIDENIPEAPPAPSMDFSKEAVKQQTFSAEQLQNAKDVLKNVSEENQKSEDTRASLLNDIRNGVKLNKVSEKEKNQKTEDTRSPLLKQIEEGIELRKVSEDEKVQKNNKEEEGSRASLLSEIRKGINLKKVPEEEKNIKRESDDPYDLTNMFKKGLEKIRLANQDDQEDQEDDSEWDD